MNKLKRFLSVSLLALAILLFIAGCGGGGSFSPSENDRSGPTGNPPVSQTPSEELENPPSDPYTGQPGDGLDLPPPPPDDL